MYYGQLVDNHALVGRLEDSRCRQTCVEYPLEATSAWGATVYRNTTIDHFLGCNQDVVHTSMSPWIPIKRKSHHNECKSKAWWLFGKRFRPVLCRHTELQVVWTTRVLPFYTTNMNAYILLNGIFCTSCRPHYVQWR